MMGKVSSDRKMLQVANKKKEATTGLSKKKTEERRKENQFVPFRSEKQLIMMKIIIKLETGGEKLILAPPAVATASVDNNRGWKKTNNKYSFEREIRWVEQF